MSVDWLHISTTGACGNGTITITADTYSELDERIAAVVVSSSAYGLTAKTEVTQTQIAPETITGITFSGLTWATDIPASGGSATKANCSYTVIANKYNGTTQDITSAATVTGYTTVPSSIIEERHSAGTLTLTAEYSGFTASASTTIWQSANILYYVYYTSTDGEIINFSDVVFLYTTIAYNIYEGGQGIVALYEPPTKFKYDSFKNNERLLSITAPNTIITIEEEAFRGCSSLTGVTIPGVTSISSYTFANCDSLTNITLPSTLTSIGGNAFHGCYSLTGVTIPDSVTYMGEEVFHYCSSLTECHIGSGITSISDSTFYYCTSLTGITIPYTITSISNHAFFQCSSLTSIIIPDSVTSIGDGAFNYCTSLTGITIPSGVTSIGNTVFAHCTSLTGITIPDSVISIGDNAFENCTNLTGITIPDNVISIGDEVFAHCNSLEEIKVNNNNSVYDSRNNCNALIETSTNKLIQGCKNSFIPSTVTSIGDSAFVGCTDLTGITIPNSVTSIGEYAFYQCSGLTSITCLATTPPSLVGWVFGGTNDCPIYVPSGSVNAYKSASGWSNYSSRIFAMP